MAENTADEKVETPDVDQTLAAFQALVKRLMALIDEAALIKARHEADEKRHVRDTTELRLVNTLMDIPNFTALEFLGYLRQCMTTNWDHKWAVHKLDGEHNEGYMLAHVLGDNYQGTRLHPLHGFNGQVILDNWRVLRLTLELGWPHIGNLVLMYVRAAMKDLDGYQKARDVLMELYKLDELPPVEKGEEA